MALIKLFDTGKLRAFEKSYDNTREDFAAQTRGVFLKAFPLRELSKIKLDDYVIGHQRPTFCAQVETKTRYWAIIQGSNSFKFGIYFGRTKADPRKTYRFARKFGDTKEEAFRSVKTALLALVQLGGASELDFRAIDENPLSQMFKAKILSLYFPDRFLNVCSSEHLKLLGTKLGYAKNQPFSKYQYLLLQVKRSDRITSDWSNPKFVAFLYESYIHTIRKPKESVRKPRKKARNQRVNFEDIQNQRNKIGKIAEEYALEWEKRRLEGIGLDRLIPKIKDLRDYPSYGYDFLSHSALHQKRYIEVKAVGKLPNGEGHRFFLSDNERETSMSIEHSNGYFFYLVFFNKDAKPKALEPIRANDLYKESELSPASYVVRFDFGR